MHRRLGIVLALGLLVLGACNPVGDGRPSKSEFALQVEARCVATAKQIDQLGPLPVDDPAATATFVDALVRHQRRLVQDLQGLAPPMGMDARVTRWLDQVNDALDAQAAVAKALRSGDSAAITLAILAAQQAAASANRTADRLGYNACSRPATTASTATTTSTTSSTLTPNGADTAVPGSSNSTPNGADTTAANSGGTDG